jgi:Rad3-related DNA helicase
MNHTDDEESSSAFPRGSDVPFPLERPYPQQVHLMDAILHSLQQHQKQQQQQQQQQQVHSNDSPHQHRALVMMLESPTGTGKSLSLACAAMTWLRYMEQQDALETCDSHNNNSVENLKQQQQDNHDNKKQNNNDDTATTTATTTDWWNAWVPPEQFEEQHRDEQARKTALETRQTLTHELDLLRQKLIPSGCHDDDAKIAAAAPLGNSTNRHPGTKHSLNHRERRENLVRSAVTTAKMIEKQKAPKLKRPSKRVQQQRQIKDDVTMDYCVHDYHSDDDDEDDDCDSRHERNIDNLHKQPDAASRLETCLDGAFLDGSIQSKTTNTRVLSNRAVAYAKFIMPLGRIRNCRKWYENCNERHGAKRFESWRWEDDSCSVKIQV